MVIRSKHIQTRAFAALLISITFRSSARNRIIAVCDRRKTHLSFKNAEDQDGIQCMGKVLVTLFEYAITESKKTKKTDGSKEPQIDV